MEEIIISLVVGIAIGVGITFFALKDKKDKEGFLKNLEEGKKYFYFGEWYQAKNSSESVHGAIIVLARKRFGGVNNHGEMRNFPYNEQDVPSIPPGVECIVQNQKGKLVLVPTDSLKKKK